VSHCNWYCCTNVSVALQLILLY